MKKIGIMGGTFNPPHIGHLIMANEVLNVLALDEIRFMPNAIPPHKHKSDDATAQQRYAMTELAIATNKRFKMEPYEIEQGGISYSFDTLKALTTQEPDSDFYFIIGGDMIDTLHTWHRIDELLELVHFVGVFRPGSNGQTTLAIELVPAPVIDLSSTDLRQRFAENRDVTYLIPQKVEQFIREEGLYGAK